MSGGIFIGFVMGGTPIYIHLSSIFIGIVHYSHYKATIFGYPMTPHLWKQPVSGRSERFCEENGQKTHSLVEFWDRKSINMKVSINESGYNTNMDIQHEYGYKSSGDCNQTKMDINNNIRVSINGGTPMAGWFVRETPIKMDDLEVPIF